MRKRNAMARELRLNPLYRSRRGKGLKDRLEREDSWSRAAKHKETGRTPGSSRDPGDFFAASGLPAGAALAPPAGFGIWFGHPYDRLQAQTP